MKPVLFMLMLVLSCVPALAVWDSSVSERWLGPNNVVQVGNYNIRVLSIDVEGESLNARITDRKNMTLYEGPVNENSGFEVTEDIRFRADSFRFYDPVHPQVKLEISKWLEVDITRVNFPQELYKTDVYKVFAVIENTGLYASTFKIELSGEDLQVWKSNAEISRTYTNNLRTHQSSDSREVIIQPGKKAKIYFDIQPMAPEGEEVRPALTVSTGTNTVDQRVLDEISIVGHMTGYIQDIIVPEILTSGKEAQIKVLYRNSWIGASNDFFIKLNAPEFRIIDQDTKRAKALAQRTGEVVFRTTPLGGGDFTLTAELSIGREMEDSLSKDVKIAGDKVYSIDNVDYPRNLAPDESGIIFVTVKNDAPTTNTMTVEVKGDGITVQNPNAVVKLGPKSMTRAMFNINSISEEKYSSLTINLYDRPESYVERQYLRPEKLIDTRNLAITNPSYVPPPNLLPDETEEEEDVAEQEEDVMEEDAGAETAPEQTEQEPADGIVVGDWLTENWRYPVVGLLAVILIILIILAVRKGKTQYIEVYK